MSSWFAFVEGKTEEEILPKVIPNLEEKLPKDRIINAEGKNNLSKNVKDSLGPEVGSQPVRCLVLRDLDSHEGEQPDRLAQSLTESLERICKERRYPCRLEFRRHDRHDNVYLCHCSRPDLAVALHIAKHRHFPHFCKSTMDDYVLKLALDERTIQSILDKESDLSITSDKVIAKVTTEIPDLLCQNGIPQPVEAKDYVRFYGVVLRMHLSPSVVAKRVLSHAPQEEVTETFASLRDAWAFLRSVDDRSRGAPAPDRRGRSRRPPRLQVAREGTGAVSGQADSFPRRKESGHRRAVGRASGGGLR